MRWLYEDHSGPPPVPEAELDKRPNTGVGVFLADPRHEPTPDHDVRAAGLADDR